MRRPLLLLDVDGVLALKEIAPASYEKHELISSVGDSHTVWLSPNHGLWINLLAEHFEVVWATGWEHDAPRLLGPLLKVADFPVVRFTERPTLGIRFSKLPDVVPLVGDRHVAWVDDDFEAAALAWSDQRQVPTLLIQPDASRGLEHEHVEALLRFAEVSHYSTG